MKWIDSREYNYYSNWYEEEKKKIMEETELLEIVERLMEESMYNLAPENRDRMSTVDIMRPYTIIKQIESLVIQQSNNPEEYLTFYAKLEELRNKLINDQKKI